MRKRVKREGFTLLEMLIAASILAIGVVAIVHALSTSYTTVTMSKGLSEANRAAVVALERLKSYQNYATLYNDFNKYAYNGDSNSGPFFVMENGTIYWDPPGPKNTPDNPPLDGNGVPAAGYGYFEFVTSEAAQKYPVSEWGTATAWDTTVTGSNGRIDLNADGDVADGTVTTGRTSGSPIPSTLTDLTDYYVVLPVKVTIRMYGKLREEEEIELVRRAWLTNNYEGE